MRHDVAPQISENLGRHPTKSLKRLVYPFAAARRTVQLELELRTLRNRYPKHLRLWRNPWRHLAAAAAFCPLAVRLRLSRVLHAAWLDRRAAFQPLQPGDLIALRRHEPLQFSQLAQ